MKKLRTYIIIFALLFVGGTLGMKLIPQFGARAQGARLANIEKQENFKDGVFQNEVHTPMQAEDISWIGILKKYMKKDTTRTPSQTITTYAVDSTALLQSKTPTFAWLGHSSIILRMEETTVLLAPVFSGSASPFSFTGPKEFDYTNTYSKDSLPAVDIIVISHDHYDHLDHKTIKAYKDEVKHFFVPLGVGAHLERWGVESNKITELNWWENAQWNNLTLTATPARHFSGRGLSDRNKTLWASWVIESPTNSIYFGGDSGYGDHFKQIGKKFGSFDIAFIECGQYDKAWPYIHTMPEESALALEDLNAKTGVPVHWAKFKLSLHNWKDPINRISKKSEALSYKLLSPEIGKVFSLEENLNEQWWASQQ